MAVFTGARDPYAPRSHVEALRDELTAANADWQITEFGAARHAFTDASARAVPVPGIAYELVADEVSWAAALAVLKIRL